MKRKQEKEHKQKIKILEGDALYPNWVCIREGFLLLSTQHEQAVLDDLE